MDNSITKIELVYFDIHARGELTRLCFAAKGKSEILIDTRIPLFMESDKASEEWLTIHSKKSPFGYLPYLNVERVDNHNQISGDGAVEGFIGRYLGLCGTDLVEEAMCITVAISAVQLLGPQLTRAGLTGNGQHICRQIEPEGYIGNIFSHIEKYMKTNMKGKYLLGEQLSLADLAIFNSVDECHLGPRSNNELEGTKDILKTHYPILWQIYTAVGEEPLIKQHIKDRQSRFTTT